MLPTAVFIILGLLQMGLMQQGRLFADYAAYRGARAVSLEMGDCQAVMRDEIAALTPTLGRSDNLENWKQTFQRSQANQRGLRPLVINFWDIDNPPPPRQRSFDTPVTAEDQVSHVHLRLYYLYELHIPFVNWIIGRYYLAQYYVGARLPTHAADPIHPITEAEEPPTRTIGDAEARFVEDWVESNFHAGRYVVPLYASWSLRMFSRPNPKAGWSRADAAHPCR